MAVAADNEKDFQEQISTKFGEQLTRYLEGATRGDPW
jgi:hypothetical protein